MKKARVLRRDEQLKFVVPVCRRFELVPIVAPIVAPIVRDNWRVWRKLSAA